MSRLSKLAVLTLILVLVLAAAGCGGQKTSDSGKQQQAGTGQEQKLEKVRITLPTWPGYGPLFLARDKGFFKEEGLDVEISVIQGLAERKAALKGNKVDGMATTLDIESTLEAEGVPLKIIWALDDSYGGDGIVAKKDIKSVADLKGRTVALDVGTTSHFFLLNCLEKAGLSENDIKMVQSGSAGDAGQAFVAGKVDAAVTWEPWLSRGVKEGNGNLIITSRETPGLIVDAVAFRKDFAESHPREMQAIVNGLAKAMKFYAGNQEEAVKIMAKGLDMKPEGFLDGIRLYSLEDNLKFFNGEIQKTLQKAVDFYYDKKVINTRPDINQMIDGSYLEKAPK
ncbi:ABC transporter substrate-binding protein [Desulfofundulus thermosubterraneus]|uniref:NitT/TauT family transport system substrate-binding protein n=1 Tax=Desulfofundulus thermosubterraneus DSM 16057 TaxID=1121432 RepID=A0A1M6LE57_9FIRM|nr:ABC transporter substrate-binding protein [Desulfofundulus thermosubterraneus]SHJ69456.1 NitT/TauT family transport system substrate-binding protein [Desulfofundulus thermosubterraneus DSM 16057]